MTDQNIIETTPEEHAKALIRSILEDRQNYESAQTRYCETNGIDSESEEYAIDMAVMDVMSGIIKKCLS